MGESKKIVIDSIERMQVRLVALKKLIDEYIERNENYIPSFEFLDYLSQAESIINYLISLAEFTNSISMRRQQQQQRKRLPLSYEESSAYQ